MKKTIYTLFLLGACSAALLQTGCKKNPTDGIKLTVDADIIKYNVLIQYVDPSGNAITPVSVLNSNVTIGGTNSNSVYNIAGKKDFTITGGMLTIGLAPDVTPTSDNPAEFSVAVNDPNYLPVTTQIKMYPGLKQQIIKVTLVNVSQPTPGITFKKSTTTLSNNQLSAPLLIATDPVSTGNTQSCNVAMPAGTQFQDVNGNQLTGTNLNVTLASFDANNSTSASAFPGGFLADGINTPNGQISAAFLTAGFANVSMTLDGQQVKKFNQPIAITMSLDPATINPNTGSSIQAGDSIQVYTYDEGTAKWSYETTAAIVTNGSGLAVIYNVQHLTWTNFTWTVQKSACDAGALVFNVPNTPISSAQSFDMEIFYSGHKLLSTTISLYDGISLPVNTFGSFPGIKVVFHTHGQSDVLATIEKLDPCAVTNVALSANPVQVISADLYGVCPNKNNQQVRPSFYLLYKEHGAPESAYTLLGYVDKGHISTTLLKLNGTYDFMSYYGTNQVTTTQTVSKTEYTENINLPDDICSSL